MSRASTIEKGKHKKQETVIMVSYRVILFAIVNVAAVLLAVNGVPSSEIKYEGKLFGNNRRGCQSIVK